MKGLNIKKRENTCNKSGKKCRQKGLTPGVLYGKSIKNFLFEIGEIELNRSIMQAGEHGILDINLENESKKTIIKDIQRDPVTHKIIHIDLSDISDKDTIEAEVPIHFIGEGKLQGHGVIVQKEKDTVKVNCTVNNLPKSIDIDISQGTSGDVYRYADLEVGDEISIIDEIDTVILSLSNEKVILDTEEDKEENLKA